MAGILLQGLRRAVEKEGVTIHFIKVKGHMDQHKGFLETFRCAKGNKLQTYVNFQLKLKYDTDRISAPDLSAHLHDLGNMTPPTKSVYLGT